YIFTITKIKDELKWRVSWDGSLTYVFINIIVTNTTSSSTTSTSTAPSTTTTVKP
ncbi:unnamed protein product, partial [Adineta ricciae]